MEIHMKITHVWPSTRNLGEEVEVDEEFAIINKKQLRRYRETCHLYTQLIMEVENKTPNITRHEAALHMLRYAKNK